MEQIRTKKTGNKHRFYNANSFLTPIILKETKKKAASLPILDYLFKFLDAYDFASEGAEDVQEDNKTLINSSVLGKVFEKINGYKDGSYGGPMKGLMKGQVAKLSDADIKAVADYMGK